MVLLAIAHTYGSFERKKTIKKSHKWKAVIGAKYTNAQESFKRLKIQTKRMEEIYHFDVTLPPEPGNLESPNPGSCRERENFRSFPIYIMSECYWPLPFSSGDELFSSTSI